MRPSLFLVIALAGCQRGGPPAGEGELEMIEAPATTDIAAYLAPQIARAAGDHKTLVVYVGASWCEPCRHFHAAAAAHQLDDQFGDLRLIAFDADRDGDALGAAGYHSPMIPLFALPNRDGRASGKQFGGSIKGDGAVAQIAPNLHALVGHH